MSLGEFQVAVSDGDATITLRGEFDLSNVRELEAVAYEEVGAGRNLCLNVSEVTFMDSPSAGPAARARAFPQISLSARSAQGALASVDRSRGFWRRVLRLGNHGLPHPLSFGTPPTMLRRPPERSVRTRTSTEMLSPVTWPAYSTQFLIASAPDGRAAALPDGRRRPLRVG